MATLRLSQSVTGNGHRVEVSLTGLGAPVTTASEVSFELSADDRERVRWYLEDYLEYPLDPAPTIAASVRRRLDDLGAELFGAVFGGPGARALWARMSERLPEVRVEIASDVVDATALPWELLRDPTSNVRLALQAASFVRTHHSPGTPTRLPNLDTSDRLRVLLVICRPAGGVDVPFRSVASQIVRVDEQTRRALDVHVLRPPTFARLTSVLEEAARAGRPYHVVHFDGHGTYANVPTRGSSISPYRFDQAGRRGYLLFEDPSTVDNQQLVDGLSLGTLLARTRVPVLVLNACRSAYAEAPDRPNTSDASDDVHGRIRAYGSLALEVADAGVPGVVAMRYSVYVVTAAQFVADLYTALLAGRPLGDAVSASRRQLAAQPNRSIAFDPVPLQDWSVPVVYETVPLALFARPADAPVRIEIPAPNAARPDQLPTPDVGFYGRDETLLALDRAFDAHRVVLLHAYAGSGKTSTAAEFARWYTATGGLGDGAVVWSSLEHHTPLSTLLNQLADTFASLLESVPWQALDDRQRRDVALQVLSAVPVLWVWDNVEPVAGFPTGTQSAWTSAEQDELAQFLRDLGRTKAKVLLTSRRDERGWIGDLPARVRLPRMPMQERIQLTKALAAKRGHRVTDVADWRPLLRYTDGNPLTITVLVGQALRENLTSRAQIEAFVDRLRAGETTIADDAGQGRTASLAASLNHGFQHAFTEAERAQLAVLHLFQDTVDVDALVFMSHEHVPQLNGLTRDTGIALLDRAAEIGLLTSLSGAYYRIHPALPWFFTTLYTTAYGSPDHPSAEQVVHAYTAAIGQLGNYYLGRYAAGRHQVIFALTLEETNLLHARTLARHHHRWDDVVGCMQGLRVLCQHLGRRAQWVRLVDDLTPDLVDPATDDPRPGREGQWGLLTEYRVDLARERRDFATAHRLQTRAVAWDRDQAAQALAASADQLTDIQRNRIRSFASSLQTAGDILREQHHPDCVPRYLEAADLCRRIGARTEEGIVAYNLGTAYLDVPELRDLDQAEHWYRQALDLTDDHDDIRRAQDIGQLGYVAYERFRDARRAGQPEQDLLDHLNAAAAAYHQALDLTPADYLTDRGVIHNQLGNIYDDAGQVDTALHHYQQDIRYCEDTGDRYGAGQTRRNVALTLRNAGRTADALLYARAALRDFEAVGPGATAEIERMQQLIARLEEKARS